MVKEKKMNIIKYLQVTSIFLIIMFVPTVADEKSDYQSGKTAFFPRSQPALSSNCKDALTGIFGFSNIAPSNMPYDLAKELGFVSMTASLKKPLYHIGMKKGQWYRKGMNSGNIAKITVEYPDEYSSNGLFSMLSASYDESYSKNNHQVVMCRADFDHNVYLYSIDTSKLTLQDLSEFQAYAEYFEWNPKPSIQDLKRMQYLLVYTYSEIGIGGAMFIFPLMRINTNPL